MNKLDLPDIQGIIVRGYRMPMVRYFLLKVETPAAARALLGRLTSGDDSDVPQITTADEWHVATPGPSDDPTSSPKRKPDYCLNVGITWPGLVALGVHDRLPRSRPDPSTPSSRGRHSGRNESATTETADRSVGWAGSARVTIT